MKIYVVTGKTGEYSDRREWFVKAFVSEKRAAELVELAGARARELAVTGWRSWDDDFPKQPNKHDPNMDMDYNGTHYVLDEIELDEEPSR